MAEHRGLPIAYLILILGAWTGTRWGLPSHPAHAPATMQRPAKAKPAMAALFTGRPLPYPLFRQNKLQGVTSTAVAHAQPQPATIITSVSGLPTAMDPWQNGGRPFGLLKSPELVPDKSKPQSAGRDTPPTIALAPMGKAGTHPLLRQQSANVYAYSFWRLSAGGNTALAPAAQYGGSQSGVILTYNPFGQSQPLPAMLIRASGTPNGEERELALGLRWKPSSRWPISLTAERRFRANTSDAYAAYLAGSIDALPVVQLWRLQAFGQAGYVSGPSGSAFYDAQAKLLHPVAQTAAIKIQGGAGAWAGGQKGASRVDVGPTVAAEIDAGPATLHVQLDWRMRALGAAHPKDGLALTVSTGF